MTYIWGPTSTGKTRSVYEKHDPSDVFQIDVNEAKRVWWDGYQGQRVILIDEFRGLISCTRLLKLLRPYQIMAETKGGTIYPVYDYVYITSNKRPEDLYVPKMRHGEMTGGIDDETRAAFMIRLTHVIHMDIKRPLTTDPPARYCYGSLEPIYYPEPGDTMRK